MRMITTEGAGPEAREGTVVVVHVTIQQPGEDGQLYEIYRSKDTQPAGLRFELGRSEYSEAVERSLLFCKPGAVIDSLCTDPDCAADHTLGIFARQIPEKAKELWCSPRGPVGVAQGALKEPSMMAPKPEDTEPPWQPPQYAILFHILLDSVLGEGGVPMYMEADERLAWVNERKVRASQTPSRRLERQGPACAALSHARAVSPSSQLWATELFKRGWCRRAMHGYKKAMLDLETPVEWHTDAQLVERNRTPPRPLNL